MSSIPTAELIPVEPKTTVYVSAGSSRYHRTPDCKALESMQLLNDDMSGVDFGVCHAFTPTTTEQASRDSKTPCRLCKPQLAVVADTFGHEPEWTDFGTCVIAVGACNCPYHDEQLACARCYTTVTHYDEAYQPSRWVRPVLWPCTSAVVLGLVPRTVEQDAALRKAVHGCETPESHNYGCPCETAPAS